MKKISIYKGVFELGKYDFWYEVTVFVFCISMAIIFLVLK